jgi:hypothetical protein
MNMNTKNHAISSAVMCLLFLTAGAMPTEAQVLSQTNVSAANCIPKYAGAFHGSDALGFYWQTTGTSAGGFLNYEDNEREELICAVPFDPLLRRASGTIPTIQVIVDVIDNSDGDEIRVDLFRQNGNAGSGGAVDSANTSIPETGRRSLTVSFTPTSTTRYVWFLVSVPFKDNVGISGVVGFRVQRF